MPVKIHLLMATSLLGSRFEEAGQRLTATNPNLKMGKVCALRLPGLEDSATGAPRRMKAGTVFCRSCVSLKFIQREQHRRQKLLAASRLPRETLSAV